MCEHMHGPWATVHVCMHEHMYIFRLYSRIDIQVHKSKTKKSQVLLHIHVHELKPEHLISSLFVYIHVYRLNIKIQDSLHLPATGTPRTSCQRRRDVHRRCPDCRHCWRCSRHHELRLGILHVLHVRANRVSTCTCARIV